MTKVSHISTQKKSGSKKNKGEESHEKKAVESVKSGAIGSMSPDWEQVNLLHPPLMNSNGTWSSLAPPSKLRASSRESLKETIGFDSILPKISP